MHLIYVYLLKDIADIVLDYVYKPDIKTLNREYFKKVECEMFTDCEVCYVFHNIVFNYRVCADIRNYIYDIRNQNIRITLPSNYFYSSGCNDLNRFKK